MTCDIDVERQRKRIRLENMLGLAGAIYVLGSVLLGVGRFLPAPQALLLGVVGLMLFLQWVFPARTK